MGAFLFIVGGVSTVPQPNESEKNAMVSLGPRRDVKQDGAQY